MRWLTARLEALFEAMAGAIAGAVGSQAVAFVHAYLQRLGGHVDEARRAMESMRSGSMGASIGDPATREQLAGLFRIRLTELEATRDAVASANPFAQPLVLLRDLDPAIARATLDGFTPAIPLDAPSVVYALVGVVIGWMVWRVVRWPAVALMARRRRGISTSV